MGKSVKKGFDHDAAREEVLNIYGESLRAVAEEQVRLALKAKDENVRAASGRRVVELVGGFNAQGDGRALPPVAVQVISNLNLPEYRMASGSVSVERVGVEDGDVAPAPTKPQRLIEPALEPRPKVWHKDVEATKVEKAK